MGKVRKFISKVIPKEIKPFVPYIAAMIPGAQLGLGAFAANNPMIYKALISGAAKGLTDDKANLKDILTTSAISVAPDVIGKGLGNFAQKYGAVGEGAEGFNVLTKAADYAGQAKQAIETSPFYTLGAQGTVDATQQLKRINKEELEKYNRDLESQGVLNKSARRQAMYDIYKNAGWDTDYVNSILDTYGYAKGGKVTDSKKDMPSIPADDFAKILEDFIKQQETQEKIRRENKAEGGTVTISKKEYERLKSKSTTEDISSGLGYATKGFEQAFGGPLAGEVAKPQRIVPGFADGGVTNTEVAKSSDLLNEYKAYIFEMEDLGMPPVSFREWYQMNYGAARMGVAKGGSIAKAIESGLDRDTALGYYNDWLEKGKPGSFEDFLGSLLIENYAEGGKVMVASHSGNDTLSEQLFEEFLSMGMTPDQAAEAVRDYFNSSKMGMEDGGKVVPILPKGVFYKGKAKDYPGASKAIKDALKKNREKKAEGGLLGLKKGGVPAEFDYRGGGIIKVGSKPKADDVPARLSKGEFVLTKKAVDGLGKGSNREGAKILYQVMDRLEAIA